MTTAEAPFETTIDDGICRFARPGTRWLATGPVGGRFDADAAYNLTVPDPWEPTVIDAYVEGRLVEAGFEPAGPALLTGVDQRHARGARCGPVTAVATAGVSNPAALPMDPAGGSLPTLEPLGGAADGGGGTGIDPDDASSPGPDDATHRPGTVNVLVGTTRALDPGALANLATVVAEAKAATVLATTGFTGTTTDAVIVGCDPSGPVESFSGSATPVGAATRAGVREAVRAALDAWIDDGGAVPDSVESADYGVSTDVRATVFTPAERRD